MPLQEAVANESQLSSQWFKTAHSIFTFDRSGPIVIQRQVRKASPIQHLPLFPPGLNEMNSFGKMKGAYVAMYLTPSVG
jgi:hypothetical protein